MSDMEDFVDDVGGMNAVRRDLNQLLGRLREHVPVPQGGPRAFHRGGRGVRGGRTRQGAYNRIVVFMFMVRLLPENLGRFNASVSRRLAREYPGYSVQPKRCAFAANDSNLKVLETICDSLGVTGECGLYKAVNGALVPLRGLNARELKADQRSRGGEGESGQLNSSTRPLYLMPNVSAHKKALFVYYKIVIRAYYFIIIRRFE